MGHNRKFLCAGLDKCRGMSQKGHPMETCSFPIVKMFNCTKLRETYLVSNYFHERNKRLKKNETKIQTKNVSELRE